MQPSAQDLRDRMIEALAAGAASPPALAARFGVSLSFVEKRWQRLRHRGSRAAKPQAGGRRRARTDHTALLRHEVAPQPAAPLEAWRERSAAAQGPPVSTATICRA